MQLWNSIIRLGIEYKKAALNTLAETSTSATAVATTPSTLKESGAKPDTAASGDLEMIALDNQIDPILFKYGG